jgi:hypothetical protein
MDRATVTSRPTCVGPTLPSVVPTSRSRVEGDMPCSVRSTFHSRREGDVRSISAPWVRPWLAHNRHPLPAPVNYCVRNVILPRIRGAVRRISRWPADRSRGGEERTNMEIR